MRDIKNEYLKEETSRREGGGANMSKYNDTHMKSQNTYFIYSLKDYEN